MRSFTVVSLLFRYVDSLIIVGDVLVNSSPYYSEDIYTKMTKEKPSTTHPKTSPHQISHHQCADPGIDPIG
jgi:hypothetical protein